MEKGIKESKELVSFGLGFAMAVDQALKDNYQWTDLFSIIPPLVKLPAAISGADEILYEIEDMDNDEKAELVSVVEELDLESEKSEEMIEQSIIVVAEIAKLVMLIRDAKKPE